MLITLNKMVNVHLKWNIVLKSVLNFCRAVYNMYVYANAKTDDLHVWCTNTSADKFSHDTSLMTQLLPVYCYCIVYVTHTVLN